ncbi:DUF1002 domain-containing protein [Weissella diestrammenae]|uniref:DUF1002 domain-containing protein n=1 Tax=Weissella diestrammenae TaxID=1162633 RepID=A0A7G9T6E6_9LACO|nr:DUF1002 domain-containing protein [Weissella diestrammenae]MCM0583282.1 DUF1002 domain-containing protein [Weissella diestrammenae]QNN75671.1 DUF1002 domain-containing protein [Weissella diestrammenae]
MSKFKKSFIGVMVAVALGGSMSLASVAILPVNRTVSAASSTTNKALSKAYVVYGAAASNTSQVATTLGVTNSYAKLTTTGSDASYIGLSGISDSAMISSVALAPAEPGTGTLVNIKKFNGQDNITKITSQQYAMAATMAGVQDVIITVTANQPVSGEAALAGVYKALDTDGIQVNSQNTEAANSVMSATSSAIDANKDDSSYAGKLTSAVTTTSGQLAEKKQAGQNITINVIIDQLTINLQKQGIDDQTTSAQTKTIATALQAVNEAPISNSAAYVDNAKKLGSKLKNSVGDIMAKAENFANSEDAKKAANWFVENIWTPVVNWFKGIFSNSGN